MDQAEITALAQRWVSSSYDGRTPSRLPAPQKTTDAILRAARAMTPAEAVLLYQEIADLDPIEARVFARLLQGV